MKHGKKTQQHVQQVAFARMDVKNIDSIWFPTPDALVVCTHVIVLEREGETAAMAELGTRLVNKFGDPVRALR